MADLITDALESFSESAMCAWMGQAGVQNAVGWVQGGLAIAPSPYTKAAAVALTALKYGCSFDPGGAAPIPQEGCQGRAVATTVQFYDPGYLNRPGGWVSSIQDKNGEVDMTEVTSIIGIKGQEIDDSSEPTTYQVIADYRLKTGQTVTVTNRTFTYEPVTQLRMFDNGSPCEIEPDPDPPGPTPDPVEPITGFSEELNCNITATLTGFRLNSDGTASPVIKYTTDQTRNRQNNPTTRNDIVQNCNWYGDLVYTGPSNCDCPTVTPLPENPGPIPAPPEPGACPDPCPEIKPEPVGESQYLMIAPCEKDAQGNNLEWIRTIPASTGLPAISARLEAISEQISQNLSWKTPICNDRPELKGNWRTISFRSQESSPYGKSCLRKRFRYRSLSGIGLGELVDHWKDFTFQSGAVIVTHTGSSWGSLKVWANTVDEGKRVIQHAAREAGIDADQVGQWGVSYSSSPRYGVSLPMRIDTTGGYYWITARDGENNRPIVAKTPDI